MGSSIGALTANNPHVMYDKIMGKKKFLELIRMASQPLSEEARKLARSDDYSEKRTQQRKNPNSGAKPSDTSHPRRGGSSRKSPRRD